MVDLGWMIFPLFVIASMWVVLTLALKGLHRFYAFIAWIVGFITRRSN